MKTIFNYLALLTAFSVVAISCQKEISFEGGNQKPSSGSLQANGTGGCLGAVVSGTYKKDTTLTAANYVDVSVQVDSVGTYTITTDTVNGYSFKAIGVFTSTGVQVVRLAGSGKPLAAGTNVFTVQYDGTICDFSITVTATGGGPGSAVYTVACGSASFTGTYQAGTPLSGASVQLNATVTTVGTWTITTTAVNGIVFSGSGTFAATGNTTITLNATGTPTAAGTFNVPITVGAATCNISVVVVAGPPPANDYFPRTANSNWSYQLDGVANDSLLVQATATTHSALGNTYTIFRETDNLALGWDSSGYYRKNGGNYYEWIDIGTSVGLDDPLWFEYIFLKDDQPLNAVWESAPFSGTISPGGTPIPVTAKFGYKILGKDVVATSNGVNYDNTIIVEERLYQFDGANWIDLTNQPNGIALRYYYSRNRGLIKVEVYLQGTTLDGALEMRRFQVY